MTELVAPPSAPHVPPRSILFATDLSSRSDRALDRAVLIARLWQARLVALTVIEPAPLSALRPSPGSVERSRADALPRQEAERRLRADLAVSDLPLGVRVEHGRIVETILAVAADENSGLIITGVARNEALARIVLGSTVDALARLSPAPLLVVRNRARAAYRHMVVATSFSASSRRALETAVALFPEAGLTLFHAYGNPYPALAAIDRSEARKSGRELAAREAAAFLQGSALPAGTRERVRLRLEYGDPALLLRKHGRSHPDDLLVLGAGGRGGVLGLLRDDVAQRILEVVEADVLVVPQPRAEPA